MTVKKWYSASELAGLPGMPTTDRRAREKAKRLNWASRPARGKKGSEFAFSNLPDETKAHLAEIQSSLHPVTRRKPRKGPVGEMQSLYPTSKTATSIPLSRVHKIMPIVNNLLYLLMDLKRELRAGQ